MAQESYIVYMHRFPNGKVYIGITSKKPEDRWENGRGYQTQNVYKAILGINIAHVCACCRGQRNKTGGFRWEYVDKR